MPLLKDKVAIVTGAGSGIGRAGAQLFAREGASVVVAEINRDRGEAVAGSIQQEGGRASCLTCDVRDSKSVQQLVHGTIHQFGGIDILFHNAMNVPLVNAEDRRATELPEQIWDEILRLVLTGTFLCCKYVGREMIERKQGSIILTATVDALIGQAGLDAYTAAKGGVVAMTRSLAAGLASDGVRVNAICPGFVATEPQQGWLGDPQARRQIESLHLLPIAQPEDIAAFALYLASDQSRIVTGGVFPIDSGYLAFKSKSDVMSAIQTKS
jgi:NAD(P)-dependent dehydrogenase (short-subunit alcohol dehydrogenase family)